MGTLGAIFGFLRYNKLKHTTYKKNCLPLLLMDCDIPLFGRHSLYVAHTTHPLAAVTTIRRLPADTATVIGSTALGTIRSTVKATPKSSINVITCFPTPLIPCTPANTFVRKHTSGEKRDNNASWKEMSESTNTRSRSSKKKNSLISLYTTI